MAEPATVADLGWLRDQGIQVLLSLTEEPLRQDWVEDTGLLMVHVPVPDMTAPTPEQLDQCISTIKKANDAGMGVVVHCTAGLGRTGSILAAYLVSQGQSAQKAIEQIRELRPGSIETEEQEDAIKDYARRIGAEVEAE